MKKEFFAYSRDAKLVVHKTQGPHSTLLVTKEDMGVEGFILGCHTMNAGGCSPEHIHEVEQEAMCFFDGTSVATIGGVE